MSRYAYLVLLISLYASGSIANSLQCAQPEYPAVVQESIPETILLPKIVTMKCKY